MRTKRWISSSFLESDWDADKAKYLSAEYFAINMTSTVYFEEGLKHIPENALVIEIAPHGLLQAILKRTLNNSWVNIPLTSRNHSDNLEYFLCALGK